MIFLIIIIIIITINTTIVNIFITIVSNIVTDGVVIIIKKTNCCGRLIKKGSEVTWIISFSPSMGLCLFSGESYKINKYGALSSSVCRHYNGLCSLIYLRAEDICVYVFVLIQFNFEFCK